MSTDRARETITAPGAPAAIGPYSHAVRVDAAAGLLFCSGQIPLDPAGGELVGATAAEQARRCLENLRAVCEAAGTTLARAVRVTVYMTDLGRFGEVNEVYAAFFDEDPPARVTVGVAALPRGAAVEIDAVVATGQAGPLEPPPAVVGAVPGAAPPPAPVTPGHLYHVELRHFPRNVCRFNLSAEELHASVLAPWAADRPFELGELKWDPRQARLTVLEGPRIAPDRLSMGRGWRTAQREGRDVTARLLPASSA